MPAILFNTPADFIEGIFGPAQADAHCLTRRRHVWLEERREDSRLALIACAAEVERIKECYRARRRVPIIDPDEHLQAAE